MGSKANSPKPIFDNSQLQKIMNEMIRCSDVDDLLKILLNGSWYLMSDKQHCYGWVGKLDRVTNKIKVICTTPTHAPNLAVNEIEYGRGITAQALAERIVKNIPDVSKDRNYVEYWTKTKSEIAIPIMVERVRAVQNLAEDKRTKENKTETIECRKPIGVLNFESETIGAFRKELHEPLMLLCSFAGEVIDKINRIKDIQNYDLANPSKLVAALKWMVQKGIDDDIDVLLDARDNPQLSQESLQLLDYAIKCISDREVRQQSEEFASKNERIKTLLESESNEIRDRRKQEIRDYAIEVFESENNAQQWLASSRQELGGLTPNDVIITAEGCETVKSMLSIIDYGVYA
jgi:putative methionine-R-sulfoxide reductase with GAF domain